MLNKLKFKEKVPNKTLKEFKLKKEGKLKLNIRLNNSDENNLMLCAQLT